MTVTESFVHPLAGEAWTIDDLERLPDDGLRYEIVDGSLLVSPHAVVRHFGAAGLLRDLLARQAPDGVFVGQDGGVQVKGGSSYFVPDVVAIWRAALTAGGRYLQPADVLLAVEVLSPSNAGVDLLLKRHYYAAGGIPHYWIVDPDKRTLTALALDGGSYREVTVVEPGTTWRTEQPFPLALDPAEFL